MNNKLQEQLEATKDLDILGSFLWWNFKQCSVSHKDLVEHFKLIGIPEHLLIAEPSNETTFMRVCSKHNNTTVGDNTFLIRLVVKDKDRIVVAGVAEGKANESLEYNQDFKIILNRLNGVAFIAEGDPNNQLANDIIASYLIAQGQHDTYDLCKQALDIVKALKPLHVRDRGGVYLVLEEFKSSLNKLEQLVNELGLGTLYVLPQVNLAKTREEISKVFLENTVSDINDFKKEIAVWDAKNPHDKSLLMATSEIDVMKETIKTYGRVLKVDVEQFAPQISELENGIKKISQRKIKVNNE